MLAIRNLEKLSAELMRVLRGTLSQRGFGKALGFTSNVAYAWESGRRFPEASVFLKAAALSQHTFREEFLDLVAGGS